ncbi:MAG: hypothetical protein KKD38_00905 [Candidatus Delongbacteria bacterium]|nr:hypothetical protein [Candidatus Delongbacteria bacterium]
MEFFVIRKDSKVRIKLMLSFLLIIYVIFYSLFEKNANILPFFFFGFFFASPLIDYSFYMERVHRRFSLLLGKGFSLRQIFVSKSIAIFLVGLISGTIFTIFAIYLNRLEILNANFEKGYLGYFLIISLYGFWMIIFSGLIQTRYEIIFPVRLLNILAFILFVNFQEGVANYFLKNFFILQLLGFAGLIAATAFLTGRVNKDKIS